MDTKVDRYEGIDGLKSCHYWHCTDAISSQMENIGWEDLCLNG